jgi:hypothetical protein
LNGLLWAGWQKQHMKDSTKALMDEIFHSQSTVITLSFLQNQNSWETSEHHNTGRTQNQLQPTPQQVKVNLQTILILPQKTQKASFKKYGLGPK